MDSIRRTVRVWDLRFYRAFEDWELAESYSLFQLIQTCIPQDDRSDTLCWQLKGDGKFDTRSYYHEIRPFGCFEFFISLEGCLETQDS